jgi:hypothetical protein
VTAAGKSLLEWAPFGGPQLGILDTNTIFNDLNYQLRHGRAEGAMVASARSGALRLVASSHVFGEVYERAPTQERRGFSTEKLLDLFEGSYLPFIDFVDLSGMPVGERAKAVADADADDLPTAQLALALAPCHVYTDDPDLTQAGFGQERNWLRLVRGAERTMQVDQAMLLAAELARWGWRKVAPWLGRQLRETRSTDVLLGGAIGVLTLSLLSTGGLERLGKTIDAGERFIAGAGELGASAGLGLLGERVRQTGFLSQCLVPADGTSSQEARLARELASRGPLELDELSAALAVKPHEAEAILKSLPCFVPELSGWRLGRRLSAQGR